MRVRIKSMVRTAAIFAALIALTAPTASAQTPATAPTVTPAQSAFFATAFATAVNGREVWITTSNSSRLKVRVAAVAPAGLTVTGTSGPGQTIAFGEITRIQKVKHRVRTGTLVGLGVGAGLGALGSVACSDGSDAGACVSVAILSYAGIGAGIGAIAGAIRNKANRTDDIVFEAGARMTSVAFAPIVSRTRKGAALSITWR